MKTLTITIPTKKPGHVEFFILNILKSNFLKVVDMDFSTKENLLDGEKKGFYTIQ